MALQKEISCDPDSKRHICAAKLYTKYKTMFVTHSAFKTWITRRREIKPFLSFPSDGTQ